MAIKNGNLSWTNNCQIKFTDTLRSGREESITIWLGSAQQVDHISA